MQPPLKRARTCKPCMGLVDLPQDVLELIIAHVDGKDLKQLALTSRQVRAVFLPYIMKHIRLSWTEVLDLQKPGSTGNLLQCRCHVESLRISSANSYNEYQMDTFGQLVSRELFPRLKHVAVNSANSSYWLKYNTCSHIRHLTLYSDNTIQSVKIFHLSHVNKFTGLRSVTLHSYHFNWTEEEEKPPQVALHELRLHDCTWEYPFELSNFNRLDSLHTLSVTYSRNNSFMLSERFVNFLEHPFCDHSKSLRDLTVSFIGITKHKRLLTPHILEQFLDSLTNLQSLALIGWTANTSNLAGVIGRRSFRTPMKLHLKLENLDGCKYGALLRTMAAQHENLRLHISSI